MSEQTEITELWKQVIGDEITRLPASYLEVSRTSFIAGYFIGRVDNEIEEEQVRTLLASWLAPE